jgi:hypothetical protein
MAGDMLKEIPRPKMWYCLVVWPLATDAGVLEIILDCDDEYKTCGEQDTFSFNGRL